MNRLEIHKKISEQLEKQLHNFFIDVDMSEIDEKIEEAYGRCLNAIAASNDRYLSFNGTPRFLLDHSGCWSLFLYYLSNSLKNVSKGKGATKVYYLNKILHGVDWFYEVQLPEHFMTDHPVGSVLGRAEYGDFLFVYQGVTIGGNISLKSSQWVYPVLGNNIILFSNATVLGEAYIGNNVIFSANSYVINEDIPDDSIVFGSSPNLIVKYEPEKVREYMGILWKGNRTGGGTCIPI